MEESPSKKNGRWLYVFGLTYLILLLVMRPEQQLMAQVRWIGFFILTQGLTQVIFPQFRCSKPVNLSVLSLVIITTIAIPL
ncbi:hypothetical protein N8610_01625 [Akkermansiaceae bacterium]|nr:hypothetical protein [Akkermansiaceae bacterium]MDA7646038.1 hypothetical protein [bacterium]MDA7527292.1 hypothetical protein [Akkermansiaceae bacterium]MDA7621317.1 hypothetical protein [Akkermansiaceae bacterium]MDA7666926.1 hypothetical protein [Akkermansiaceae bacterium]|tara:strand:+ start:184 stop:426 length:243 start_codon:yes stop_codon:yes gene_type:complete